MTTTNTETKKPFAWTEENAARLVELYQASDCDNSAENLKAIADEVTNGEKSAKAVQSKLVSMKAYVKTEPRKVGGASSVRKAHYVRAIAETLEIEPKVLESLEGAKKDSLAALLDAIGGEKLES